jgi:alkylation response protein AidB-like acyl-CoA dehydrogenase
VNASPLAAARALAPRLHAAADETERARRLAPALVGALADAGLFRLCVPAWLGGGEVEPATLVAVLEELARADGAAGWCTMIAATSGIVSAYMPREAAREVFAAPGAIAGGVYAPSGTATVVDGGYRVRGRWAFASGCQHCTWLLGGCVVVDGGTPRLLPNRAPDVRLALLPASTVTVIDTWTVAGLCGTGSHDIAVTDAFVPATHAVSLVSDALTTPAPLYRFPVFGLLALGIAGVALGIARAALDELARLAGGKTPTSSRRVLRERPVVQAAFAEAEATLAGARAFLFEAVHAAGAAAGDGPLPLEARARLRLAATHAVTSAARVVDVAYGAGGGSAVYATSPLQRHFRDVHVVTQHMMVAPPTLELAGRVLLGVDTDATTL